MADIDLTRLKTPPHSPEAEFSVLGGLMLDNEAWTEVSERLTSDDFFRRDHRIVFRAIETLAGESQPFDVVTVAERLEQTGELADVGGLAMLGQLVEDTPSAANIVAYADIVRERAVMRDLIRAGTGIAERGYHPEGATTDQLLDQAEREVFQISDRQSRGRSTVRGIKDLLAGAVDRIDELYKSDNAITGVSTGFSDFDNMTSGLQRSDLVIVAGRPSMGKTAFAVNIAENAAIRDRLPVAIFSMEMPGEQLAMRMMSSLGRIDQHRVRTGKLQDDDWPRLTSAVGMLSEVKLFIDDAPGLSPSDLRARCRRIKREHGLGLVVVDYLQLMRLPGNSENRATEISEISRSLKTLAKELNVPVLALSQLNRSLEQRPNKRPVMSDLRESGAIEQDADVIVFIYRDEVYNEDSPDKGVAEIIIGKQRNGPIGTVRLTFLGQYTRFESFASDHYASFGED